jgi:solute:Na+ symporter, SSS family
VAVIGVIGFILSRKPEGSQDYFLAGRQLSWPFIGASLFAANISAEHFVGLAGGGYSSGLAVGGFEWMAVFCLAPLIVIFPPFYIRNAIFTVPEFLERRFDARIRLLFSGFMLVLSILTKISVSLWAASLVFKQAFAWDQTTVTWLIGLITALYTMKGGLRIVVYTDSIQTIILIVAAVILTGIGLHQVGGWSGLQAKLPPEMFSMVRPATHPDYPWPGMFFGVFILGSFYWSMDQVLVQRAFAARSLNEGRLGAVFCGALKITTPFLLVLPGLIAAALYPKLANKDLAYPTLLANLMPTGLLGLTVAGLAAALMGHISATYNSIATLFTRDFLLKWAPETDERRQIWAGRIAVFCTFICGALWAPMVGKFDGIFNYLQQIQAYLMLPFAGIFFAAVFWPRVNSNAVLACLGTALFACPAFIANSLWIARGNPTIIPGMAHSLLKPWLHTAMVPFLISMVVLALVTLWSAPPPEEKIATTTIRSWAFFRDDRVPFLRNYRVWFAVVAGTTVILWWSLR